ncbi:hypothetical protein [Microcoleus sp. S13C4]|uniref:hypothetical protein n=1 Tax=Microcoleus sp. S13C4 TaxID=3055410 RepID=UPI002FCE8721
MVYSNSEIEGKSFYQSEPLIARLRGIIRDYPEGVIKCLDKKYGYAIVLSYKHDCTATAIEL